MSELNEFKLSDRPKLWLPIALKWIALLFSVIALMMWLGSWFFHFLDLPATSGDADSIDWYGLVLTQLIQEFLSGAMWFLFFPAITWMLSLVVDKIDELVWLNASDEDREEILAKRKKKNAKN